MVKKIDELSKESELIEMARKARRAFTESGADYDFSADEISALIGAVNDFEAKRSDYAQQRVASRTARIAKDMARKHLRGMLGRYVRRMHAMPHLSAAKLVNFGTAPADKTKTPVNAPETEPQLSIEYHTTRHVLRFWEDGSTRRRRKPYGVIGAEIYVNFDGEREDSNAYRLKEIAVRSPHTFRYQMSDVGKTAHYYLRWLTRRGERSPASRIVSAVVTL